MWLSITKWGLHQLQQPCLQSVERAVEWLGGVQAQDYAGAEWSIGLRIQSSTKIDVEKSIVDRRIVRTWARSDGFIGVVSPT
ncbi:MAG TPA: crosslink repair DNA glycosylase YcaQ family protein [Spirochaetia bacterium]|nr:crosslink repair DNA glycosylase YcaQ family protein [Spirochaetia bacterium]